ncbi:MAG: hypothetical protein HYY56_06650 [Candidatus Omnitrophica bacterium]|nr:hypothetical protein [Candidatus Omnitrophota bacterium]
MNLWDREEVKIRINQLHRLNRDLSYTGVWEENPELLFAGIYYYKNWSHALTSSGIEADKARRHEIWSKDKIKRELISLSKEGEDLSYNEFERRHPNIFHGAVYYFGSWRNALGGIGVDYDKVKKAHGEWSKGKIIRDIKALEEEGVDLSIRAIRRQGYGPLVTMSNFYFGSWREAIRRAGLDYDKIRKRQRWSKKRVIENIKELNRQGIDLSYKRLRREGYGKLVSMGCYYYPSWGKAIERAGLDYTKIKKKPGPFKKEKDSV